MNQTIAAHFNGEVIVPEEPLHLAPGRKLRVSIEVVEDTEPRFADLLRFAADLPDAPSDLSSQHDHYASGSPKK